MRLYVVFGFLASIGIFLYCAQENADENEVSQGSEVEEIVYNECVVCAKEDASDEELQAYLQEQTAAGFTHAASLLHCAVLSKNADKRYVDEASNEAQETRAFCEHLAEDPRIEEAFAHSTVQTHSCAPPPIDQRTEPDLQPWYQEGMLACEEGCYQAKCSSLNSEDEQLSASCTKGCASICKPPAKVGDPLVGQEWPLLNPDMFKGGTGTLAAWPLSRGSPSVNLAVIDKDIHLNAPDLRGDSPNTCFTRDYRFVRMYAGEQVTDKEHGTKVIRTMAACSDNRQFLAGTDWYSNVVAIEINHDATTALSALLWASGVDVCASARFVCPSGRSLPPPPQTPIDVVNFSIGFLDARIEPLTRRVMDQIHQNSKVILVLAAGNSHRPTSHELEFLARYPDVIAVGATDIRGYVSFFSNWGKEVDILAPGSAVPNAIDAQGRLSFTNGTSFSAPVVAGILGLMVKEYKERGAQLSRAEANDILEKTANPVDCQNYCDGIEDSKNSCRRVCCKDADAGDYTNTCTAGIVNAQKAVTEARRRAAL